jgi:hypothetical protein
LTLSERVKNATIAQRAQKEEQQEAELLFREQPERE